MAKGVEACLAKDETFQFGALGAPRAARQRQVGPAGGRRALRASLVELPHSSPTAPRPSDPRTPLGRRPSFMRGFHR